MGAYQHQTWWIVILCPHRYVRREKSVEHKEADFTQGHPISR